MANQPEESSNNDEVVESNQGNADTEQNANAESKAGSERKILIGSQRDAAAPVKSATIRHATLAPDQLGSAIQKTAMATQAVETPTSDVPESPVTETPVTETAIDPVASQSSTPPATTDDELEAALGDLQMDSLMDTNQPSEDSIEIDSRVKALVTRIHNDNVFFSLKGRFEGIASKRQFKTEPEEGAMLEVRITGFKEEEGLYEVTIPGASVSVADWDDLTEGAIVETKITGSNTGGLECTINSIRGFIPASQIDIVRVENFGDFVNTKMQCVVMEVNPARRKLVLSRRAILERAQQEKKAELMKTLAVGQTLDGIVTRLMDFGAFVDIGGVEGLVHVSKMSWDRVSHPKDVLEPGQKISVKVDKIMEDTGKIALSYRDTQENPWTGIDQKYPEGSLANGTVTRLAQFGAFVKLESGVEGLIHISELAHHRVVAVKNVVNQGDSVQVKILSVDPDAQKIGLSLKATQAKPEKAGSDKKEIVDEPIRESTIKKRDEPLKGGRDRGSGGDEFGLNW